MPAISGLHWDDDLDPNGNVQHIRRHRVSAREVREVLESAPVFIPVESGGKRPAYVAMGFTATGRLLEVWGIHYLAPLLTGYWRTVTAMDARPAQRDAYERERARSR